MQYTAKHHNFDNKTFDPTKVKYGLFVQNILRVWCSSSREKTTVQNTDFMYFQQCSSVKFNRRTSATKYEPSTRYKQNYSKYKNIARSNSVAWCEMVHFEWFFGGYNAARDTKSMWGIQLVTMSMWGGYKQCQCEGEPHQLSHAFGLHKTSLQLEKNWI